MTSGIKKFTFESFITPSGYLYPIKSYLFQQTTGRPLTNIMHTHDFYEILATLSGKCIQRINGKDIITDEGEFVILTPGDRHAFTSQEENTNVLGLSVKTEEFENFAKCFMINSPRTEISALTVHRIGSDMTELKQVCDLISRSYDDERHCKLLLCLLLTYLEITQNDVNEPLPENLLFLQARLQSSDEALRQGVKSIVTLSGYSQSQLLRLVKKYFGMTLQEYCKKLRLDRAYGYIISTDMRFETISDAVGYCSFSHFQKAFKLRFAITPAQLRKLYMKRTV